MITSKTVICLSSCQRTFPFACRPWLAELPSCLHLHCHEAQAYPLPASSIALALLLVYLAYCLGFLLSLASLQLAV